MKIEFEHHGSRYRADLTQARSIAINLDFEGPQPNHFGTERASRMALELGEFVGNTAQGGSCNVDTIRLIPHCNGTHSESVGHIVNDEVAVAQKAVEGLFPACLLTVSPISHERTAESYRPPFAGNDRVVTRRMLVDAFQKWSGFQPVALALRTLPNDPGKPERQYGKDHDPAFFTVEAIKQLNDWGIEHLLVDLPSVDRMYDDGLLTCHHLFWNVPERTHRLTADTWQHKTITEMVVVPDQVPDGNYLLNLQFPAFFSDAAPSRPILYPVQKLAENR